MSHDQEIITGCPKCGVSVFRYDGKIYTPVREYLLTGQLVGRNTDRDLKFRRAYVEHRCLPEDLSAYSELSESVVTALRDLIENNPPQWLQTDLEDASATTKTVQDKLREVTVRKALTRPCPRCQVAVGNPCENLIERKRGNSVPTKNPHSERLPPVGTAEAAELQLAREEVGNAIETLNEIQDALKADRALEKLLRLAERL